jgi:hypothetical protein
MSACGTTNGYHAHKRRDEKPCDPCREAWNAYQRDYRTGNEDFQVKDKAYQRAYQRARSRAAQQLIANHRDEFNALLAAERAAS